MEFNNLPKMYVDLYTKHARVRQADNTFKTNISPPRMGGGHYSDSSELMWGSQGPYESFSFRDTCKESVQAFWKVWRVWLEPNPIYLRLHLRYANWQNRNTPLGLIAEAETG